MKRFKMIAAVFTAALLLVGASLSAAAVELTFWTEWSDATRKPLVDQMLKEFEAETGIRIIHRAIPNDVYFETLRTGLSGNNRPDLFVQEGYQHLRDIAAEGLAYDLTEWYEKHGDRFIGGSTEPNRGADGRMYGVPVDTSGIAHLYYNVDILERHGIELPKTWNEFLAAAEKLKQAGVTPIAFGNNAGWPGMQWWMQFALQTAGADKINAILNRTEPGQGPHWNDPDMVRAAEYYVDLMKRGYFSPGAAGDGYQTAVAYFSAGRSAFFHTGSWLLSNQFPPNLNWDFFPFPRLEGEPMADRNDQTLAFLNNISISSTAKDIDAALKFIEWFTDVEQAKRWVKETGYISAIRGGVTEETAGPRVAKMISIFDEATGSIPFIDVATPPSVGEDKVYNGGVAVLTGQMTPQEWMDSVEAAHQEELAKRR